MFEMTINQHPMRISLLALFLFTAIVGFSSSADTTDITFTGATINPYAAEFDT